MSQKSDTPALVTALFITAALLGIGIWWFLGRVNPNPTTPGGVPAAVNPGNPNIRGRSTPIPVEARLSTGGTLLVMEGVSPDKQAGVQAIATGQFDQAISRLEAALAANRNDPEALIYLNNARIGTQPAYTIAVSTPIATSINPALEILRGAAQAQDEINRAGGINGIPLKVMLVSDDNDPAVSQQVANALVKDATVLGVIGHFGSDASLAAAPVYTQAGLVMISPTSTSIKLSGIGNSVFRTVPSDRFTADALSRHMIERLNKQNAAVFFNGGSDYSKSLKDEFTTALYGEGGQIVAEFDVADPQFDPAATVANATQQGAEVLFFAVNTATLDPALQAIAVNRRQLPLLGGDSFYNPKLLQIGGDSAVDMVVAVPWVLASDPQSPFVRTAQQLWGADVNWRTAMTYDAAQVLIAALKNNPTRTGVQETLRSPSFTLTGATGTIRFLPSGDRNQAMQLVVVKPSDRLSYGFTFEPVK